MRGRFFLTGANGGDRSSSVFGTVWVNRIGYEAKGESMLYPLDGGLNLPRERYSLGVRSSGGH